MLLLRDMEDFVPCTYVRMSAWLPAKYKQTQLLLELGQHLWLGQCMAWPNSNQLKVTSLGLLTEDSINLA
jgi:hypothetical protein